jgi:ribonuclease Z
VKLEKNKRHSTTYHAATHAKQAGVGKLLIGHFSNKYDDDRLFLSQAKKIFANTEIAIEGKEYEI